MSAPDTSSAHQVRDDPYTIQEGRTKAPPSSLLGRLKSLGPGIVVSGSIVGSGEILLTAGLGASAGFVLLWWVLLSCWLKSLIQAELARYVITTGDTYLRALNRMPGKFRPPPLIRGTRTLLRRLFHRPAQSRPAREMEPIAWPIWLGLLGFVPGLLTSGGIIGGAGQALSRLIEPIFPDFGGGWATLLAAAIVMLLLWTGKYARIEKVLVAMVVTFTFITIACALLMQTTEYRATFADIASGLRFDFPLEHLALAIGMYGATGVASSEIAAYTYWCVEKGYPSFVGGDPNEAGWTARAKGWIRVVQTDVWVTLAVLTCATLAFYFLGAGVLHRLGVVPEGQETVSVLANMYTVTLGQGAFWLFMIGAFFILFSTTLSGLGAGSRSFPDLLVTFGFIPRQNLALRQRWIKGYIIVMPLVSAGIYSAYQSPIVLILFGATFGAFMLPVQALATIYMQRTRMDARVKPRNWVAWCMGVVLLVMLALCLFYLYFQILPSIL